MNPPQNWSGDMKKVCAMLGSPQRCRILRELATTEWLPVSHLSKVAGVSRTSGSQHMAVLVKLKVVERGMGRLYRLAPALRPAPGAEWLDFGWLQLRLGPLPLPPAAAAH